MLDPAIVAAAAAWGLLPGLALLAAIGSRWSGAERVAAAPGLSLALVSLSAYTAEFLGLAVAPLQVIALATLVCGAALLLRRLASQSSVALRIEAATDLRFTWVPWLVLLLPLAILPRLEIVATLPLLPPSLHDGLDHANWFRLIYETRSLNPHEVLAPPLAADGSPSYYPWGLHGWLALVAHTPSLDPVAVLMQGLVLISAVLPLSVYVFTAYLTGRGWTAMAAAVMSLVFWWLPFQVWSWGGYPLLAGAVAALPLCRLALDAVDDWRPAPLLAAGACGLGVLLIHPSQAMLTLMAATVVSVTLAAGRELPWRPAAVFVLALAGTGIVLAFGDGLWAPLAAFMERARTIGAAPSQDPRFAWPLALYFQNRMQFPDEGRFTFAALCLVGGIAAIFNRRHRPLVALHVAFSLLIPLAPYLTWTTSLWYHLPERLWYAQYACLPALAALGIAAVLRPIGLGLRRWIDLARWPFVAWPVALWLVMLAFGDAYDTWARGRLRQFALNNPHATVTDKRVAPDFEWIEAHVPRDAVIFNAPADWGLALPFTGRRTVFWSGGYAVDPQTDWHRFLLLLRREDPFASQGAAELAYRDVEYIYVGMFDGAFEVPTRLALNGSTLRSAQGLELLYESPTALVFGVRDERAEPLGLRDSARIRYEGFHAIESLGTREWRWSAPSARLHVTRPAGDCYVRIIGPDPETFTLSVAGVPLDFTPRGFRLPEGDVIAIDIALVAGAPRESPGGGETRELGIRIRDVGLMCSGDQT